MDESPKTKTFIGLLNHLRGISEAEIQAEIEKYRAEYPKTSANDDELRAVASNRIMVRRQEMLRLPGDTELIKSSGGYAYPDIPQGQLGHDKETGMRLYRFTDGEWIFAYRVAFPFDLPRYPGGRGG